MKNNIILNKVTDDDCKYLWVWRNDPKIRNFFLNTGVIPWEEHKKWFYSKIKDTNTKIYIVHQGENKVGVIRFEIEKDSVKVSVNLNPEFFGKGLGSKIIKLGTEIFLKETKTKKHIIAKIKKDNIASQKAFEKAGYLLIGKRGNVRIIVLSYYKKTVFSCKKDDYET